VPNSALSESAIKFPVTMILNFDDAASPVILAALNSTGIYFYRFCATYPKRHCDPLADQLAIKQYTPVPGMAWECKGIQVHSC
jgi:hypothetical protein